MTWLFADEPGSGTRPKLLVPADLPYRQPVILEQVGDAGPGSEPPDPGQQSGGSRFDAVRPVDARQEGSSPATGAELVGRPLAYRSSWLEPGRANSVRCCRRDLPEMLDVAVSSSSGVRSGRRSGPAGTSGR
jgi:hypothetical protein